MPATDEVTKEGTVVMDPREMIPSAVREHFRAAREESDQELKDIVASLAAGEAVPHTDLSSIVISQDCFNHGDVSPKPR